MAALGNFAPSGDYAFPYRDLVGARVLVTGGRGTLGAGDHALAHLLRHKKCAAHIGVENEIKIFFIQTFPSIYLNSCSSNSSSSLILSRENITRRPSYLSS